MRNINGKPTCIGNHLISSFTTLNVIKFWTTNIRITALLYILL